MDHKNILIVKKTSILSFERHVILKTEPVSLLVLTGNRNFCSVVILYLYLYFLACYFIAEYTEQSW